MAEGQQHDLGGWLNCLNLAQHNQKFSNLGITTIGQLQEFGLDDSFLNDLGISSATDRRIILDSVPVAGSSFTKNVNSNNNEIFDDDNIYENVQDQPKPSMCKTSSTKSLQDENEDIYMNYSGPPSNGKSHGSKTSESGEGGEVKKKPVPRPRISKMKKNQMEKELKENVEALDTVPQSPLPVASPRKSKQRSFNGVFQLSGAILDDSNTDSFDPFAVGKRHAANHVSDTHTVKTFSDDLADVFSEHSYTNSTESNNKVERPSGFSDNFLNASSTNDERLSNNYGAIWTSPAVGDTNEPRRACDMSPFTPPFLPNPCHSDSFQFQNQHSNENTNHEQSSSDVEVNRGSFKLEKHIYVNDESENLKSPPPPSFPPPELPPDLPPVPPRTSGSAGNAFLKSDIQKITDRTDDELYSSKYVARGLFTSSKLKTLNSTSGPDPFDGQDPFTDINFQRECYKFNQPEEENIFGPADEEFQNFNHSRSDIRFRASGNGNQQLDQSEERNLLGANENAQTFNQPGAGNIFTPGQPVEQAFDPFGIYDLEVNNSDNPLDAVPPVPVWHETVQPPKAQMPPESACSLYSLATPIQQETSYSDNDTSEGELSDPSSPDISSSSSQSSIGPVVDVVITSPSPRKSKQKSGYLWKQGGVKANRGWRKRWVVFDGKTLRYYPNHKSQISRRVIPLACMNRVELCDIKDKNADRFKFNLINQNRTFLFAAETLNECTLWANTLMEAIINYEKPKDGEKEGLDMYNADKLGFIKFERNKELFVAIKSGKLAYYDSHQDYKIGSPLNEIDMKLASVKEVGRSKLQLSTHYGHFILLFNERMDCLHWKMAMEDAIADGLGDNSVLDNVRENESNHVCVDCRAKDPQWASINIGVVLCKNCAGIHRDFDVRVSRVKSLRMDTTIWTPSLIEMMKALGNENANSFWENRLQPTHSINTDSSPQARKQYILDKYETKLWIDRYHLSGPDLNQELLRTVVTDDVLKTMRIIYSGANILFADNSTGKTAFELAKEAGQRMQMEFLYHNGGDRTSRASADIDEALALRLRAEITMEGHLLKTGPKNRNAFMDRYCVIEHGCLRYFINEKSSTARDSIDNESMLCVQAVVNIEKNVRYTVNLEKLLHKIVSKDSKLEIYPCEERSSVTSNLNKVRQLSVRRSMRPESIKRYPNAFELSTTKSNNRTYLFAATTQEEKMTWMRTLSKLFCPISFIKEIHDKEFSLAGNFYVKAGVASEWQKTWILVDKKVVKYLDDSDQKLNEVDLRKVSNIQYLEHVAGQPCPFSIEGGKCLTIDIPGRSLYFQADLQRDTERLYEAFSTSMKGGGPTIEDQQLTPENVPVLVQKCLKFIEDHGFKDEGVYRHAAQESKIQGLLQRFLADAHSMNLALGQNTVNEVANCLKRFFRQLKDPLFTKAGYEDWIKCAAKTSVESKLSFYKFQLGQLPLINRCTVKTLILHLASLSTYSSENKMDVKNIALAFGSSLVKGGAEAIHQENLPLEMRVIEDLITHHNVLLEEEVQRIEKSASLMDEVQKRIKQAELAHFNSILKLNEISEMKITVYYQHRCNQSCDYSATKGGTVGEAVDSIKKKFRLSQGQWVLYEVVYSDILERPVHPSECLLDVVMSWSSWEEEYRKNTHLVLKSAERLLQLDEVYDPNHALFAEFKYKEKKDRFKKYSFGFNQSKLSLFKDLGYNTQPSKSWQIEDLMIYFGADPKKNAQKYAFSFYAKGEKIGKGDMPLFGRCICCTTENELINWMAAMLKAKHPDGYLT